MTTDLTGTGRARWHASVPDEPVAIAMGNATAVVVGAEGTVLALDWRSGDEIGRIRIEEGLLHADVSPSGEQVAVTGPFGAWLWRIGREEPRHLVKGAWCAVARWVTEERLAIASGRHVDVFDESGQLLWHSDQFPSTVTDLTWLGGRHRIAVAAYGGVHIVEPRKGGNVVFKPFTGSLLAICSSPNGRWIVSGNQDATLQVFRSDKETRLEMEGYPFKIRRVAFDGSGRYLANDGAPEVSVWDFGGPGPEGRAPVLLVSDAGDEADAIGCFAWNPSEALLAVGWESGLCHTYVVQDGVPAKQKRPNSLVSESDASVACLAWAPDATGLCIADASGAVTMLEVEPAS